MIVKCKESKSLKNEYRTLVVPFYKDKEISGDNYVVSHDSYTTPTVKHFIDEYLYVFHSLTVGNQYYVYGILIYENKIRYLLSDDENMPAFFESRLFEVTQAELLLDWELMSLDAYGKKYILLTHPSLISCYEDFRDLLDPRPIQMRKFLEYKEYVETYF